MPHQGAEYVQFESPLRRRFCRNVALYEDGKEPVNHVNILSDLTGGVMVSDEASFPRKHHASKVRIRLPLLRPSPGVTALAP